MTSGRKPTTVEGQVRAMVRTLTGPNGVMDAQTRLIVMDKLVLNARTEVRYNGTPAPETLIRLAAHAIAWCEEGEADE